MAWLHAFGSTLSDKAWDDDGDKNRRTSRKRLTRKGCPVSDHVPVPIAWPFKISPFGNAQ